MAIGSVTEAVLSRVLEDVLALDDIPEVESRRLAELCRILHALEGLFVENSEQVCLGRAYVLSFRVTKCLLAIFRGSVCSVVVEVLLSIRAFGQYLFPHRTPAC